MKNTVSTIFVTATFYFASSGAMAGISDHTQANHQQMMEQHSSIGRPGIINQATRNIDLTANDQMSFSLKNLDIVVGKTVSFTIKNTGELLHEFVLGTQDQIEMHRKQMTNMPQMKHLDNNALSINSGETKTLVWKFTTSGNFLAACTLPGHYEAGMITKINVSKDI